ncbi:hypothetical protein GGG16DRAFT_43379 [Schizophyllum commune]
MADTKTDALPLPSSVPASATGRSQRRWKLLAFAALASLPLSYVHARSVAKPFEVEAEGQATFAAAAADVSNEALCAQPGALLPKKHDVFYNAYVDSVVTDEDFKTRVIDLLSGAVQVPTEAFDDMGPVGEEPRWEIFGEFHAYLDKKFPLITKTLKKSTVNTYGLVYEWTGSDSSLLPILLTAHQDVVPVEPRTVAEWVHPPYSGYFDGERIWGRGASDDKSSLIAIMATIETLLENDFTPSRSVVLAFGIDEEAFGKYGAATLGPALEETYGKDGFALLVDEGGGYDEHEGAVFATPAIAEKGYLDVRIQVDSPGGHSSVPPPHTTIGILADAIVQLEEEPFTPKLSREEPFYWTWKCYAAYAPNIDEDLRAAIKASVSDDEALKEAETLLIQEKLNRVNLQTTQAIDMINGGVKSNALPEQAHVVVNHRILTQSSVAETQALDTSRLLPIAARHNLTVEAFGKTIVDAPTAYGHLNLSVAFGHALNPAPVTPIAGDEAAPYEFLSGVIKATYNGHRNIEGDDNIVVAPSISTGNTDTQYYWNLTKHIFRYNHSSGRKSRGKGQVFGGAHTVNESTEADNLVEKVRFFALLILNADESRKF